MRTMILLGLLCLSTYGLAAEGPGKINTSGLGSVNIEPDQGYITVGCTTVRPTAPAALTDNSMAVKLMKASIEKLGVAAKDVKTIQFHIGEHHITKGQQQVVDGYEASNLIRITVCDISTFGQILEQVVKDGANRVQNISFGTANSEKSLEEARKLAVASAVAKAKTIAGALGVQLGQPESIVERDSSPRPMYDGYARSLSAAGGAPVSGGELTLSVSVEISWNIAAGNALTLDQPNETRPGSRFGTSR